MGLKGFCISGKQEEVKTKLVATFLICSRSFLVLSACWINLGKKPIISANIASIDLSANIYTGSERFMIDLPLYR